MLSDTNQNFVGSFRLKHYIIYIKTQIFSELYYLHICEYLNL